MRFHTPSLLAASSLFLSHTVPADIIIFKTGERLEGKVLREVDGNIVVEVKVTASISDEKTIPRVEVLRIEKETEDEKLFRSMAAFVPAPDLLSEKDYKERMERLEAFLQDYPDSRQERKVKQMLDALGAELDVVSLGGVKLDGKMVTRDQYMANAYGYDARISERKIKDVVARRDYLAALRMFAEYEARFPESEGRVGVSALMLQVLGAYRAIVTENLASLDGRLKERENGLLSMTMEDRLKSERAIRDRTDAIAKRYADEKAAHETWVTPDAFHKESLASTLTQITAMIGRLEIGTPTPGLSIAEVYRDAWKKLADGTDEEKIAVLESAKENRLPEPYLVKLRERAAVSEEKK